MNPTPPPPQSAATFHPSHCPNPQPPPPPRSLTDVLSDLSHLLQLSTSVLRSLPPPIHATAGATFVSCPFNPNHRLPPSSLFSHYLNCPSPLSLPHSFHYPLTLRSSSSTAGAAVPNLPADSSELTVSLENYIAYNAPTNNFFYQNCPGPVTPANPPPSSLNLPRFLCTECADFNEESRPEASVVMIRFLPSEIWAIRSEIESWGGGFPTVYSSRILRAILRLRDCNLLHLYDWMLANSPRYGVIIDCAMRDHLVVLVKLCLKVIVGEAYELAGFTLSNGAPIETKNVLSNLGNRSFECPVLVKAMGWLAFQLSVLYGEVNGKYFAVDMLKECISDSSFHASLFPLEGQDGELSEVENADRVVEKKVKNVVSMDSGESDGKESLESKTVGKSMIFISGVAAAVAALHERCLIEEKIKALRYAKPPSAYQRNLEHAHVSKIADEERKKRPDYRPIVEYDGFLRHRSSNEDAKRVKTREELLAEERDYKRRRMSYRGKKLKRNTVEVMREIIEEHMEELRLAGGVGGMSKDVEETEVLASKNIDRHASVTIDSGSRRNSEIPEESRGRSVDCRKDIYHHHYSGKFNDDHRYPNRGTEGIRYDRNDTSSTRDVRKFNSQSRKQLHGREKSDRKQLHGREKSDTVVAFSEYDSRRSHHRRSESRERKYHKSTRDEHEQRTTHKRRRDEDDRSSRKKERAEDNWEHADQQRSKSRTSRERYDDEGRHDDRRKSKTNQNSSSRREVYEFEDRYDPRNSHDPYEDD